MQSEQRCLELPQQDGNTVTLSTLRCLLEPCTRSSCTAPPPTKRSLMMFRRCANGISLVAGSDVGYHYSIRKNGDIQEGRAVIRTPATQGGHESGPCESIRRRAVQSHRCSPHRWIHPRARPSRSLNDSLSGLRTRSLQMEISVRRRQVHCVPISGGMDSKSMAPPAPRPALRFAGRNR